MANNEPKVRERTRIRRDGSTVTKSVTKGKMADGGKYKEKAVTKTAPSGEQTYSKTKGRVVYGESTKKALGVTGRGKSKVSYANLSKGTSGYGAGGTYDFSGYKTKRMSPGVKTYKKSSSSYKDIVPSETYQTRSGKTVTTPKYTEETNRTFEKTKKSKGRGMKKSYNFSQTGGYNEQGKKMKDITRKKIKSRK